ncbi:hypothetical protein HKI87_14g75850 [Chloropicon roscoffensis]|uniref:DUF6816 domain-containing protein n=1 Tax=Chloropicon roscoffensis TaxID=1461544 RepID=A0AAX4PHX8_9CHLO
MAPALSDRARSGGGLAPPRGGCSCSSECHDRRNRGRMRSSSCTRDGEEPAGASASEFEVFGASTAGRRVAGAAIASALPLLHGASRALAAPELVSDVWEKLGGGQADIYYPDFFEGCWQVGSTLVAVETPKGIEYTNDADQIQQAIDNELNRTLRYEQCFVRNSRNRVVADRMHNTRMITEAIMGARDDIAYTWNVDDPNVLKIHLRGLEIFTRVTRRFSSAGGDEVPAGLTSLETSELFEQVFDKGLGNPKVKASRLITKWKWRGAEETPEGQPQIIATQVLNNYLTPMSSSDQSSMDQLAFTNLSDPASVFKYKMGFFKVG